MSLPAPAPKTQRRWLPASFVPDTWASLQPWYQQLADAPINSVEELTAWMARADELGSAVQEEQAWRYIRMTCDTADEAIASQYSYYVSEVLPQIAPVQNQLDRKYYDSPWRKALDPQVYKIYDLTVAKDMEIFREENVPLQAQADLKGQEYDALIGAMTLTRDGKELTMQQAGRLLEEQDRGLREAVWRQMTDRRLADREAMHRIYDELVQLRTQIARNAGYQSYSDYKFKELGRFDYTRADVQTFHAAVEAEVKPLLARMQDERRRALGLDSLRPWDLAADYLGTEPLKPFETAEQLLAGTIALLDRMNPQLADMIRTMERMGHFDLASRKGKAAGGYNYPLMETGVPFIFMNAVGTQADLTTMVHECGHAVHAFLTRDLDYSVFKSPPSEVAELASMSFELLTMGYWDQFYADPRALARARYQQIWRTISILPWIATVDAFQTWVYDHPDHSWQQRDDMFVQLYTRFHGSGVAYDGLGDALAARWQQQGHIFDVPFYYIEYGLAQLGSLQVWQNHKANPAKAMEQFLHALSLGYTKGITEVYQAAGVAFRTDAATMRNLAQFTEGELAALRPQLGL